LQRRADGTVNLKELSAFVWENNPTVVNLGPPKVQTKDLLSTLDPERIWLISSGSIGNYTTGSRLPLETMSEENIETLTIAGSPPSKGARLLGLRLPAELPRTGIAPVTPESPTSENGSLALAQKASAMGTKEETLTAEISPLEEIPYGPDRPPELDRDPLAPAPKFPFVRGSGPINAP
jgi:ATP-binding cassette subfamily B protein